MVLVMVLVQGFYLVGKPENINYELSMPKPQTHYFEVKMILENVDQDVLDLKMPVWAPGSYLIREFPKNVEGFHAKNEDGDALSFEKVDKNTWRINTKGSERVEVNYSVYAYEISVRTSFLDADHGYLNGTSVFMYDESTMNESSVLKVNPYKEWNVVSTALPERNGEKWVYEAENYDQLVDCPIEIGNHKEYKFKAAGVDHTIAMYGEGNFDIYRLKNDMTTIIEGLTDIYGENPNDHYLFIIQNLENGGGGLEHTNSTTLQVNRWVYQPENDYLRFLNTVIHEYSHLWLVKRIRPTSLMDYNYNKENYTHLLWVMEGFSTYYAQLMLTRLGFMDGTRFLNRMAGYYNRLEETPGNKVEPVSMASFDAWIKYYRQDENSHNSQISYYAKGAVLASLIDIMVIHNSNGAQTLDDVMRYLYEKYYKKEGAGITDQDMKDVLEKFAGHNLDEFYNDYVNGTKKIDYQKYYDLVGLNINEKQRQEGQYELGVSISQQDSKLIVKRVERNSAGWEGGINVNDEIIALDGYRVNSSKISNLLNTKREGEMLDVLVARDGKLKHLNVEVVVKYDTYYDVSVDEDASKKKKKLLSVWLSGK